MNCPRCDTVHAVMCVLPPPTDKRPSGRVWIGSGEDLPPAVSEIKPEPKIEVLEDCPQ